MDYGGRIPPPTPSSGGKTVSVNQQGYRIVGWTREGLQEQLHVFGVEVVIPEQSMGSELIQINKTFPMKV